MPEAVEVTVDVEGLTEVNRILRRMGDRAVNLRPAFERIADNLEGHVGQIFRSRGAHIRKRWRPLRASTLFMRRQRWGYYKREPGPRPSTLRWTGRLASSFRQGSPDHTRRISRTNLVWGSRDERAPKHHQGGGVLPKRTLIGFVDDQQDRVVVQPMLRWITRGERGG
jgi:hypothetical protein